MKNSIFFNIFIRLGSSAYHKKQGCIFTPSYKSRISFFSKFIDSFNKLYVLVKSGDYFKRAQEQFFDYLERLETNVDIEEVILPMSAGNLSDGEYHIEELLQGNLGMFVKKMMNANGKNEIKMCVYFRRRNTQTNDG